MDLEGLTRRHSLVAVDDGVQPMCNCEDSAVLEPEEINVRVKKSIR